MKTAIDEIVEMAAKLQALQIECELVRRKRGSLFLPEDGRCLPQFVRGVNPISASARPLERVSR